MKTYILACSTLQEELNDAMKQTNLDMTVLKASNDHLQKLLTGPYPADQFLVIPPQTTIQESDLSVE